MHLGSHLNNESPNLSYYTHPFNSLNDFKKTSVIIIYVLSTTYLLSQAQSTNAHFFVYQKTVDSCRT